MKTIDLIEETTSALMANKVRSGLTVLGIVIGISSVIIMVSIGQGAQVAIKSSIEGLGSNLLMVLPGVVQPGRGVVSAGRGSAQTLKNTDIDALKNITGIGGISAEMSRRFQVSAATGNNTNTTIMGAQNSYAAVHNLDIAQGSFITDASVRGMGREAVLGATVARDLYGESDPLGKSLRIGQTLFRVTGILGAKGGAGFSGPDDMVFVPLSTMQKIVSGSDYLSSIAISVRDKKDIQYVRAQTEGALLTSHRVTDPDFSIISQEDILGTLTQVIDTFTLFLASIASISLLVGGIGIMNMMLTNVTERTREIGLRKAIGAKQSDITLQFLAESVCLTLIGGMIGVALGVGISFLVTFVGILQTQVSWTSIALAFGVSAAIGIIFGYYPARRAASLNPIQALRYE